MNNHEPIFPLRLCPAVLLGSHVGHDVDGPTGAFAFAINLTNQSRWSDADREDSSSDAFATTNRSKESKSDGGRADLRLLHLECSAVFLNFFFPVHLECVVGKFNCYKSFCDCSSEWIPFWKPAAASLPSDADSQVL